MVALKGPPKQNFIGNVSGKFRGKITKCCSGRFPIWKISLDVL